MSTLEVGYVVESPATRASDGVRTGTFRVWVATEARAKEIASQHSERTYRAVPLSEMPEAVRENMLAAAKD